MIENNIHTMNKIFTTTIRTVKDLISELSQLPADAEVIIETENSDDDFSVSFGKIISGTLQTLTDTSDPETFGHQTVYLTTGWPKSEASASN